MFDLFLYPFILTEERGQTGLHGAGSPRRSERHRAGDLLAALFTTSEGALHPDGAALFQQFADTYYQTAGTVTTAVRAALERVNNALLTRGGSPVLVANLLVLHNQIGYIVHCGDTTTVQLSGGAAQTFHDPAGAGPGLGMVRTITPRFFQAELRPNDRLLLARSLPPGVNLEARAAEYGSLDLLALRGLLSGRAPGLVAGLVHISEGKGQVLPGAAARVERAAPPPALREAEPKPAPAVEPVEESGAAKPTGIGRLLPRRPAAGSTPPVAVGPAASTPAATPGPIPIPTPVSPSAEPAAAAIPVDEAPLITTMRRPASRTWLKGLAAFFRRTRAVRETAGRSMARALPRVLPGAPADQPARLTTGSMLFISILIPVMVVAASVTVYLRSGASEERAAFLQQARIYSEQAGKQKDVALRRTAWEQTLYWINKAEDYSADDESRALRRKAQQALDSMDGIVRLSLIPAFGTTLGNQVQITRVAATASDLYLLDSAQGRVLHMRLTGSTYEYDPEFACGPGPAGNIIVGPLVGMAALPPGNENKASVLGVDATGNLLYCIPGETPLAQSLARPENNWGKIVGMAVAGGNLYVLDVQGNGVWRYDGNSYTYGGAARFFFGSQVPNLNDVIDMTIYLDDLYLIRSSGKITVCTLNSINYYATRCTDPATYGLKREPAETVPGTSFLQATTTQPPDPSLFILDRNGPAIYHFSLRLNFQRQLRQDTESDYELPQKPVSAFTISPTRVVFLAFTNQVFYGAIP